jgi:hypothetical protein
MLGRYIFIKLVPVVLRLKLVSVKFWGVITGGF